MGKKEKRRRAHMELLKAEFRYGRVPTAWEDKLPSEAYGRLAAYKDGKYNDADRLEV